MTIETAQDKNADNQPPDVNTVRVHENGPLIFNASLTVHGKAIGPRAALCRCGASQNKPYCDGSHAKIGFTATGEPPAVESKPLETRNGSLLIEPQKDGPLKVTGHLEILSGTGHTINRVAQTWLCRCGASKNKPYCDGSHRQIGFVAD
jgi:CDGSH-type Zn-finger protein